MHNKYERLALYRLRASMKEFLGELPPEVERSFAESREPDGKAAPRAFVPTRPTVLRKGERVRINVVVPGTGQGGARDAVHPRAGNASLEPFAHEVGAKAHLHGRASMARDHGSHCWIITLRQKWKRTAPRRSSPRRRKRRSDFIR